jgi:YegS/Rv2252/BmrU family lipid kinase
MKKYCFLVNPTAGGGTCEYRFKILEDTIRKSNIDYDVEYSEYKGHLAKFLGEKKYDYEIFIIVGGDGTILEFCQSIYGCNVVFGIIPMGTGNDFAKALKIPLDENDALNNILHNYKVTDIDAGLVNEKVFINISGMGYDVEVLKKIDIYKKKFHGMTAYLFAILHALINFKLTPMKITYDNTTVVQNVMIIAVANGTHFAGGINISPESILNDGSFDVCIIRDIGRIKFLTILPKIIKGKHLNLNCVDYLKVEKIEITSQDKLEIQLDGEIMCSTPAKFEVKSKAFKVLC